MTACAALAAGALGASCFLAASGPVSTQATVAAASTTPMGIDVSSAQHPGGAAINWPDVAAAGYQFAAIKATEGNYYVNPYYANDATDAVTAGLYVAAYEFANPADSSGTAAAQYTVENAGNYKVGGQYLPLMLDIEYDPYNSTDHLNECYGLTPAQMVSWISGFTAEAATLTGAAPIIYTPAGWWDTCTANSTAFGGNLLWIPSYSASPPATLPAGWSTWSFWQYTDTGSVTGISGDVDLDSFSGSAATLDALANPASYQTVAVLPTDAGGGSSGGFAAWAVDSRGTLWNGWQTSPGSSWQWAALGSGFRGTPVVEPVDAGGGTSGGFTVWVVDSSGNLWNGWQTSAGSGWKWADMGGGNKGTPALTVEPVSAGGGSSGGFAIWLVDGSGRLMNGWQTSTGSSWNWASLGGGFAGTPAVEPVDAGGGTSGGFAAWAVSSSGNLWNGWQTSRGSAWKWADMGGGNMGTPAVTVEPVDAGGGSSGGFAIWLVDGSGRLMNGLQTSTGSSWTWANLDSGTGFAGTPTVQPVDAGGATSGGFAVWAVDSGGTLWNGLQSAAGSSWTWASLETGMQGTAVSEPVDAGGATSGGFAVWVIDSGGNLWNGVQASAASSWTWANVGVAGG